MKLYLLVKKWIKKKLDRNLISVYLQTKRFCQIIGNQVTSDDWPVERMMPEKV